MNKEYITKDSGKRKEFASGMKRDTNEGKPRPDLVYYPVARDIVKMKPSHRDYEAEVVRTAYDLVEEVQDKEYDKPYFTDTLEELKQDLINYVDVKYGWDAQDVLQRVTGVMTRGAQKYTEHNWKQAEGEEELNRFAESMLRHLLQFVRGEDDEDHLAAVWFNIGGIEYVVSKLYDPLAELIAKSKEV